MADVGRGLVRRRSLGVPLVHPAQQLAPLGCGSDSESSKPTADAGEAKKSAASPLASITLAEDPGDALAISAARKVESGKDVVVVGRIDNIVLGYASFTLTDIALEYCGQESPEDCKTPWDYCCIPSEEKAAVTLMVMVDAADGVGPAGGILGQG